MLRHSTNLPDALRIVAEREARAERTLPERAASDAPKHTLRVRPSFVRLARADVRASGDAANHASSYA